MSDRIFGKFVVYAGAFQSGDEPAVAHVTTKPTTGEGKARMFTVMSQTSFRTAEDAMRAAHSVVASIQTVSDDGVPYPLTYVG